MAGLQWFGHPVVASMWRLAPAHQQDVKTEWAIELMMPASRALYATGVGGAEIGRGKPAGAVGSPNFNAAASFAPENVGLAIAVEVASLHNLPACGDVAGISVVAWISVVEAASAVRVPDIHLAVGVAPQDFGLAVAAVIAGV